MRPKAPPKTAWGLGGRGGLTLIELLASLAILGAFVAGAGAWLSGSARAGAALSRHARMETTLRRAVDTLRDDLDACEAATIAVDERSIVMTAAAALPGEAPGWARVTWHLDIQRGELRRQTQILGDREPPVERIVLSGVRGFEAREGELENRPRDDDRPRMVQVLIVIAGDGSDAMELGFTWSSLP